jgi:diguanylate cyclase
MFAQVFDMINLGLVILDGDLRVVHWNRWMTLHSSLAPDMVAGRPIVALFPNLDTARFRRNCKSVLAFGNLCFFSQKLHHYLFPFKPETTLYGQFEFMQQSCTMGPLRDEDGHINYLYIAVQDVTEVAAYQQRLTEMNERDALTGVYNRRFLENQVQEEIERWRRYHRPFSVIFLDLDHFKRLNDNHGHHCGDLVLKAVAQAVAGRIRRTDYFARYGGEEFCCLLPETELAAALHLAESLRALIATQEVRCEGASVRITASLGVASAAGADDPASLLRRADQELYRAKTEGRNRVMPRSEHDGATH